MSKLVDAFKIQSKNSAMVMIDLQERLIPAMPVEAIQSVIKNAQILIRASQILEVPFLFTEQYPKGLGNTVADLSQLLGQKSPYEKLTFSSFQQTEFRLELERLKIQNIILFGIETHVCVYQTALDLLQNQIQVYAAADAMCSRTPFNHQTGLQLMRDAGAVVGSTETFLFQLLEQAGTPVFKEISKLVK